MANRLSLAEVVEEVRSGSFEKRVDAELVQRVLEIEQTHVEDRARARDGVSRAIHDHLESTSS